LTNAKLKGKNGHTYHFSELIGRGQFGVVYRCSAIQGDGSQQSESPQQLACKVINMGALPDINLIVREVEILLAIKHKRVIHCIEQLCVDNLMFVFLPLLSGGSLASLISSERLSTDEVGRIVYQIVQGIAYLHQKNICHRDLKPDNILCSEKKPVDIVIADFGLSRTFDPDGLMNSHCGSSQYAAPEVFNSSYTAACDMWSLGATVNEMIRGPASCLPLSSLDYEEPVPEVVRDFVKRLLEYDPKRRMTAEQALNHDWMRDIAKKFYPEELDPNHAMGEIIPTPSTSVVPPATVEESEEMN